MSLLIKDQFAAYAMQGLVAEGRCRSESEIAKLAYRIADAMLEAKKISAREELQRKGAYDSPR